MLIFVSIILFIFSGIVFLKYKDILCPSFISSFLWASLLFFYGILNHGMYSLSNKTLFVILLWNISILSSSLIFSNINITSLGRLIKYPIIITTSNKLLTKIVYIFIPFLFYIGYQQGISGEGGFFFNLRMANTGIIESEHNYGIFEYLIPIAYVLLLSEFIMYKNGTSKRNLYILLIINFLIGILTMAKSAFIFTGLSILFVCMLKKRISFKKLILAFSILIIIISLIQILRSSSDNIAEIILDMFSVYILGGLPALDILITSDTHSVIPGQNSFSFIYNVLSKAGIYNFTDNCYTKNIFIDGSYLLVPYPTNVYTVIAPFYLDFSYWGVIIFGFITGGIAGYFYRRAKKGEGLAYIIYPYICCVLFMQFFSEYIFNNLSYFIQLIFWGVILTRKIKFNIKDNYGFN